VTDKPLGFIALRSLKQGPPDPAEAIAQIRRIYFRTSRKTIEHDMAHAIELLKSLPDEDTRDRAAVYMDGLSQMRSEWAIAKPDAPSSKPGTKKSAPASGTPRARAIPGRRNRQKR
jgi:hypothetical protein